MNGSGGVVMMTAKLVGLPFLGGMTAAGLAAQSLTPEASALSHDILYVGVGLIAAILILAVVIAVAAGKMRQQVTAHERRLWVIEDKGSPALQRLTALLERECDVSATVLEHQQTLSAELNKVEQRLVRVETLLRIGSMAVTEPLPGLG